MSSLLWSISIMFGAHAGLLDELDRLARARRLVAVRRVHQHGQLVLDRQRELREQRLLLGGRHRVEADLAHRDDPVLGQEARQDVDHLAAQEVVVGLLRVQADRAVMADAELRRRGSAPSRAAS